MGGTSHETLHPAAQAMTRSDDLHKLPTDLPVPVDDGACEHLLGAPVPTNPLVSTSGRLVSLRDSPTPWTVVYFYPRTGLPNQDPPGGLAAWDAIPGTRGCTPQTCAYRDHHAELGEVGAQVFGVSTQDPEYQREAATRLHIPFELLSDERFEWVGALALPTLEVAGIRLVKRLTLIVRREGYIHRCFYPVFPPDADAGRVLDLLRAESARDSEDAIFETERLRVRTMRWGDLSALVEVYGDAGAMRWVGDGRPLLEDDCARWIAVTRENYELRGYGMFTIVHRSTGEPIGFCGIVHPGGQETPEVKYAMRRSAWGGGLATEAVAGLLGHAARAWELRHVIATVAAENAASLRVLAKVGMAQESVRAEPDGTPTLVYKRELETS